MTVNEFLEKTKKMSGNGEVQLIRPRAHCKDGYSVSIQASEQHYCHPRKNMLDQYDKVELGYPSCYDNELLPYAENPDWPENTVYASVPVNLLDLVLKKHGGIVEED